MSEAMKEMSALESDHEFQLQNQDVANQDSSLGQRSFGVVVRILSHRTAPRFAAPYYAITGVAPVDLVGLSGLCCPPVTD